MHHPCLLTSGALFTQDYLVEDIAATANYLAVDVADIRVELEKRRMLDFDPVAASRSLNGVQKRRLQAIAQAGKALPWEDVDEGMRASSLIGPMTGSLNESLAEISRQGWAVLHAIGARR